MRTRMSSVTSALALLLAFAGPVSAGVWPNTSSTSLTLASGNNKLDYQAVGDGQGGLFMVWVETIAASFEIFAQHVTADGVRLWGTNGVQVTSVFGNQTHPLPVPDGSGGLIIQWLDVRNPSNDIYAQRLNAAGVALWTTNGVAVCSEAFAQSFHSNSVNAFPVADGSGGFWCAFTDVRTGNSDVYVQRVSSAGVPQFITSGVPSGLSVCNAAGNQTVADLVSDGAGGIFVAWTDARTVGNDDIYGSHVNGAGVIVAGGTTGSVLCNATGNQSGVRLASDGMGGFVACWLDPRSAANTALYAGRFTSTLGAIWASNGVAVCDLPGSRTVPQIIPDGNAGAFIQWLDTRSGAGTNEMYAARVLNDGTLPWAANGAVLRTGLGTLFFVPLNGFSMVPDGNGGLWTGMITSVAGYRAMLAVHLGSTGAALTPSGGQLVGISGSGDRTHWVLDSDGNGGALYSWWDSRVTTSVGQILANKVDRYNYLGSIEPTIQSVRDVVGDQGGRVKLSWAASPLDVDPTFGIAQYRIWRSAPARAVAAAFASQGVTSDPDVASATGATLLANGYAWEYLGVSPAGALPVYSYTAATTTDSIGTGNPRTAFMVEAQAALTLGAPHWYSAPDSGYSVDNLPPAAPALLTGQYAAGVTRLHWTPNTEPDLAGYRIYRGTTLDFATDAAHRIAEVPDTGAVDVAGAPFLYKVTALDSHGNESRSALLSPVGTTGVGDGPRPMLALAPPAPNPVRSSTAARVRFSLPEMGKVRVSLLDAQGREVRLLIESTFTAGEHSVALDGPTATASPLAPGLYFVRLTAAGQTLIRRLTVLD